MTKVQVAQHLLTGIGAPVNHRTMGAMVGWMNAEGGHWANSARFNPLNTTQHAPGSTNPGFSAGVQAYRNWNEGLNATLQTLKNGDYNGIIRAFRSSDPQRVASAIGASPWGTSGAGAASAIQAALGTNFHVNQQGAAPGAAGQAPGAAVSTPGMTTVTTRPVTTSSTNKRAAAAQAFLTESTSAIPTDGKIPTLNPLGALENNIASGAFTTSHTHNVTTRSTSLTPTGGSDVALAGQAAHDAGAAGQGDAAKLMRMIKTVVGAPYNQGNHSAVDEHHRQIRSQGTDCSGLISWLMGPHGLGIWNTSLATPSIASAPGLQPGRGHTITIWNNKQAGNAGHVFIQIGNQFFASEGGVGVHQLPMSEVHMYLTQGSDGGTYQALHPKGL